MKRLTCEMCGGTDLVKEDGVFVCKNCGVKYSPEEAKKLMIEGTVQVAGTVKIDHGDQTAKLHKSAQAAFDSRDFDSAQRYYSQIVQIDPADWEAAAMQKITYAAAHIRRDPEANLPQTCLDAENGVKGALSTLETEERDPLQLVEAASRINSALYWLRCSVENNLSSKFTSAGALPPMNLMDTFNDCAVSVKFAAAETLRGKARNCPELLRYVADMLQECQVEFRGDYQIKRAGRSAGYALSALSKAYWQAHPEEKEALTAEQKELKKKLAELDGRRQEIEAALPEKAEAEAASRAREEAVRELESITGLFKGKQRRAAQERVDEAEAQAAEAERRYQEALAAAIAPLTQERSAAEERLRAVEGRLADPQ